MKVSVRAAGVAMALLIVGMLPAAAGAAQTLYAQGGGGNTGAPCSEAEPCNLGKAVKGAEEAGPGVMAGWPAGPCGPRRRASPAPPTGNRPPRKVPARHPYTARKGQDKCRIFNGLL